MKDDWIFISLPIVALLHIFEEYVYPGRFPEAIKKLIPRADHLFTKSFHIIVNTLFLLLCLVGVCIGKSNLIFSLSVFGLVFINALLHIRGAIVNKRYYPGLISSILLYIPLAVFAFYFFLSSRQLTWLHGIYSFMLGICWMGTLMVFVLSQQSKNTDNT